MIPKYDVDSVILVDFFVKPREFPPVLSSTLILSIIDTDFVKCFPVVIMLLPAFIPLI